MNKTAHMTAGVAACFAVESAVSSAPVTPEALLLGGAVSLIGSVLPDCDNNHSELGKAAVYLAQVPVYCLFYQYMTGRIVNWACAVLMLFAIAFGMSTGHRTATHSIPALLIFTCLMYGITLQDRTVTLWFAVAYLSHLALDLLNRKGLMLLWPVDRRWCLRLTPSNELANRITIYLSVIVVVVVAVLEYMK